MIIIIDGYNVLKQVHHMVQVSESVRAQFIRQLGVYAQHKGHKITVVFDGGSYEWPHKESIHGVYVIYVGYKETADEYIQRYVKSFKQNDLLLVSTDRALGRAAHALGVQSLDAADFYAILQGAVRSMAPAYVSKQSKAVKMTDQELAELDTLMEEMNKIETKTEDLVGKRSVVKQNELSKNEKKMLQKLKKL